MILPDWWLPASVGFVVGMLTAFTFRHQLQRLASQLKGSRVVSYLGSKWRWVRERVSFAGMVIIMLSVSVGGLGYVAFENNPTIAYAKCTRDYNEADAKTSKPRVEANAAKDEAYAEFIESLEPVFKQVRDPKAGPPTSEQLVRLATAVTTAKTEYDNLAAVREKYPPPPPPSDYCKGVG